MKNLRGFIPTMTLVAIMLLGSTFAHAGLLVSDRSGLLVSDFGTPTRTEENPCVETKQVRGETSKLDWGIIIGGNLTGIIIGGNFAGIIIGGNLSSDTPVINCGIIIGGN